MSSDGIVFHHRRLFLGCTALRYDFQQFAPADHGIERERSGARRALRGYVSLDSRFRRQHSSDQHTPPVAVVWLSGSGPWRYDLMPDGNRQTRHTTHPVDSVYLPLALPGQVYRLQNVFGQCGAGTLLSPETITVTAILATPESAETRVVIAPNPAYDYLKVQFETASARTLTLIDSRGIIIRTDQVHTQEARVDVRDLPSGVYLLRIDESGRRQVFRVVKQ